MGDRQYLTPVPIFSYFIRALAHTARTPLSVVSNELQYLATQVKAGECDLALRRCRELSDLFSELQSATDLGEGHSRFSLEDLVEAGLGEIFEIPPHSRNVSLFGNKSQCSYALRELVRVLNREETLVVPLRVEENSSCVCLQFQVPAEDISLLKHERYTSISEFMENTGGAYFVSSALVDAILLEHQAQLSLEPQDKLIGITIQFLK